MNDPNNVNEAEVLVNASDSDRSAEAAGESPSDDRISEAESARYFRNALIGLLIGIPAVFVFAVAGALAGFEPSHMNSAFQFFMIQFSVFLWGVYNLVKLKGYSWHPTLLGLLYLPGLLVILLLPVKNREASSKIRTLSIICVAWFLLSFGIAWLVLGYFMAPSIHTVGI